MLILPSATPIDYAYSGQTPKRRRLIADASRRRRRATSVAIYIAIDGEPLRLISADATALTLFYPPYYLPRTNTGNID